MGIPHLIASLQPYAVIDSLAGQDNVVIDGPALAYHVYSLCQRRRAPAKHHFGSIPSYSKLQETAISWLNGLLQSNATIKRIYFDGFLPPSKLETRTKRLIESTSKWLKYYNSQTTNILSVPDQLSWKRNNRSPDSPAFSHTSIPLPPPFLVPAILEALIQSTVFKPITFVVAGEADLYCSKYIYEHGGGLILTSDSDLLIHELGPHGRVSFFNTVQPSEIDMETGILQSELYHPAGIATRFSLPTYEGLKSLAFEILMDQHGTLPRLLGQAKDLSAIKKYPLVYREFRSEYDASRCCLPVEEPEFSALAALQKLDPRLSEYILQLRLVANGTGQHHTTTDSTGRLTPHIYLPFILDCPTRMSAWETTTSIRRLAYGIANLLVPKDQRVQSAYEHKRQQSSSKGREIELHSLSQCFCVCSDVLTFLAALRETLPSLSPTMFWIGVAVHQIVEWSNAKGKSLSQIFGKYSSQDELSRVSTWDLVHFHAQIEGSYYSFRMLKQVMSLVVASVPVGSVPDSVARLQQELESLPPLAECKSLDQATLLLGLIRDAKMVESARHVQGLKEQETMPGEQELEPRKKKRKNRVTKSPSVLNGEIRSYRNPFDVLEME